MDRTNLDMGDPDVGSDIQVMSEVGPIMIDGSDTGLLALPVVANTQAQVDVRWEVTLERVPPWLMVAVLRDGSILNLTVCSG